MPCCEITIEYLDVSLGQTCVKVQQTGQDEGCATILQKLSKGSNVICFKNKDKEIWTDLLERAVQSGLRLWVCSENGTNVDSWRIAHQ